MSEGAVNGMITTNIDLETGISYGVIQANHVGEAWYEHSQAYYGTPSCGWCGNPFDEDTDLDVSKVFCTTCGKSSSPDDCYPDEPIEAAYTDDQYMLHQTGGASDIFVIKSPYFTYCRFCSPCAPGAGHLESEDPDGIKAYCLGNDWFEGGAAPYAVYSVETGERV